MATVSPFPGFQPGRLLNTVVNRWLSLFELFLHLDRPGNPTGRIVINFNDAGVEPGSPEALKAELATGKGDGEMLAWIEENAPRKRTPWEIQRWSAYFSERGPDGVETLEFFAKPLVAASWPTPDHDPLE